MLEQLKPSRLTQVVDVGAAPIDGAPPYIGMLRQQMCCVTGFEPNPEMFDKLRPSPLEVYLPNIIGDGLEAVMHHCRSPGMNSLLRPNAEALAAFTDFEAHGRVEYTEGVLTTCLDDLVKDMDFLKIDIQGGELMAFDGATRLLRDAVVVHTEVSFVPLYHQQPTIGDIDEDLRARGFIPHRSASVKTWPLSPFRHHGMQLLEADMVYVRDFTKIDRMTEEQIRQLGWIVMHCYHSLDLADRCVAELKRRGAA